MKCCIFQGRLSMCFLVTVPVCVVSLPITPLQFHLTTTLMSFSFSGSCLLWEERASWMQVKCGLLGWEHIHSHLYFSFFSCFFRSKMLYKSVILAQGRGCVLCCLLILTRTAERLFSTAFLCKLPKSLHFLLFQDIQNQGHHYMAYILLHSCLCLNNLTLYCLDLPFNLFPFLWCIWMQFMKQKQGWGLGGSHW